jgi:hypothetical protein
MERQYWAARGRKVSGPHPTREAAIEAHRAAYPFNGPAHASKGKIMTGYGTFGPSFDIQWSNAREL